MCVDVCMNERTVSRLYLLIKQTRNNDKLLLLFLLLLQLLCLLLYLALFIKVSHYLLFY